MIPVKATPSPRITAFRKEGARNCCVMAVKCVGVTKYAANVILTTRISFIEMANLAEKVGAEIELMYQGICSDSRIGCSFSYAVNKPLLRYPMNNTA